VTSFPGNLKCGKDSHIIFVEFYRADFREGIGEVRR